MLLLDPHGSLFDAVMKWLAYKGPKKLPIIPIDLRQDDWVVSYNALRRRSVSDGSVVIDGFVQAMAHVWGQSGTDQTPRFEKWASTVLRALYDNDLTLLESEYVIDFFEKEARRTLMQKVKDKTALRALNTANALKPGEFETQLESTANRLQRFLRKPKMRAIFGHSRVSLDLRKALDEGHIILVSLATAGALVSQEDADLFATLLLSDLWTAALERGKKPGVKPFYVYLDEFQRFITPTIARSLDEARGFGLHLTMANQFPQQLFNHGEHGKRLYDSIMENASSKAVFRLSTEENLKPLADWLFRGTMDPEEIKHTLESTKVMAYEEVQRTSHTKGGSRTRGRTASRSESTGTTRGTTSTDSESMGLTGRETYEGVEIESDRERRVGEGHSVGHVETESHAVQEGSTVSESETESFSETVGTVLIPIMGKEVSHVQFRSLEEQLHRAMATLFDQEQRECVVRLVGMKAPVSICAPVVADPPLRDERVKAYVAKLLQKWEFALPTAEAAKELQDREKAIELTLRKPLTSEEPENYRRRIDA